MGNAALSTFIIDLKLTPEGIVQILEFGKGWAASGLNVNTPREILAEDVVPDYKELRLPLVQLGMEVPHYFPHAGDVCASQFEFIGEPDHIKNRIAEIIKPANKQSADTSKIEHHTMLVIPDAPYAHKFHHEIMDEFGPAIMLDSNGPLSACMQDKAIIHHIIGKNAQEIFPEQMLVPVRSGEISIEDHKSITSTFPNGVVLKAPRGGNGKAVRIVNQNNYNKIHDIVAGIPHIDKDFLIVAQDVVQGRLIEGPKGGDPGLYDPTIRTIITALHDNGETRLICHNVAYNKFPNSPAKHLIDEESLKSTCGRTPVSSDEKAIIFQQLHEHLTPAIHNLFTGKPGSVIHGLLDSNDEMDQLIGLRLLANKGYCEQNAIRPNDVRERLVQIFTNSDQARNMINGQLAGWSHNNPQRTELNAALSL